MKKIPKRSDLVTNRQMDLLQRQFSKHLVDTQSRHAEMDRKLREALNKARKDRNRVLFDFISNQIVHLYVSAGWKGRAFDILTECEQHRPKDLDAKYKIAHFYFLYGGDYRSALKKANQIKLSRKPGKLDYDSYFNALALKGQAQLLLGKTRAAVATMKEMAIFTARHLDKTIFFWDMAFVTEMIEKRLGLRCCKKYLAAIDTTEQVSHDQATTKRLLKKVNQLLTHKPTANRPPPAEARC